jgi:hypothetical protein
VRVFCWLALQVFVKGVSVLHKYMDPVEVCRT